jgi:hypothetical protein
MFYVSHSTTGTGSEIRMRDRQLHISLRSQVLRLSLTWVLIGAVIGVVGVERKGAGIEIVCMMIGGMIVLLIPGIFLGVIGGDARGSALGACAGFVGCWLAEPGGAVTLGPQVTGAVVIFSGLLGATGFLFVRALFWKYRIMFRCIRWLTDTTSVSGNVSMLAGHFHVPDRQVGKSVPHKIPSTVKRLG